MNFQTIGLMSFSKICWITILADRQMRNAEEYAHHLLFSFCPFRHEGELKYAPVSGTYLLKLQQPNVLDIVNRNRHIMESYSDIVDDALVNLC